MRKADEEKRAKLAAAGKAELERQATSEEAKWEREAAERAAAEEEEREKATLRKWQSELRPNPSGPFLERPMTATARGPSASMPSAERQVAAGFGMSGASLGPSLSGSSQRRARSQPPSVFPKGRPAPHA